MAIGKDMKKYLFDQQKGKCMYCGVKLGLAHFHIDHKTPRANEGKDTPDNLQLLCGPCNTRKGALTDGEFRRKYKLTPARQAKRPPSRELSQSRFEKIGKGIAAKKAKKRREEDSWW